MNCKSANYLQANKQLIVGHVQRMQVSPRQIPAQKFIENDFMCQIRAYYMFFYSTGLPHVSVQPVKSL